MPALVPWTQGWSLTEAFQTLSSLTGKMFGGGGSSARCVFLDVFTPLLNCCVVQHIKVYNRFMLFMRKEFLF